MMVMPSARPSAIKKDGKTVGEAADMFMNQERLIRVQDWQKWAILTENLYLYHCPASSPKPQWPDNP